MILYASGIKTGLITLETLNESMSSRSTDVLLTSSKPFFFNRFLKLRYLYSKVTAESSENKLISDISLYECCH